MALDIYLLDPDRIEQLIQIKIYFIRKQKKIPYKMNYTEFYYCFLKQTNGDYFLSHHSLVVPLSGPPNKVFTAAFTAAVLVVYSLTV